MYPVSHLIIKTSIYKYRFRDVYFIVWVLIQFHHYLIAQIFLFRPREVPSHCFLHLGLCFLCPDLGIYHFSKGSWFPLLENNVKNQHLGAKYINCYWDVIATMPFQWTKLRNKCRHMHCAYICICIYFCIYL